MDKRHRYWHHRPASRRAKTGLQKTVIRKVYDHEEKDRRITDYAPVRKKSSNQKNVDVVE